MSTYSLMTDENTMNSPGSEDVITKPSGSSMDEWSEQDEEDEQFDLTAWYESGKPLFTKEAIRHLSSQIRNPQTGDKITLLTIDGKIRKSRRFHVDPEDADEPGREYFHIPSIFYSTIEHLEHDRTEYFSPGNCAVSFALSRLERDKVTKIQVPVPPDASEEESIRRFQDNLQSWKATSDMWKTIASALRANLKRKVDKVIGLACGRCFMIPPCHRNDRIIQHCLILLLRELLMDLNASEERVLCYAQDPDYTDLDVKVLQQNHIQVLEDPDGFLEADDASCVLSFGPNVPVRQIITDVARPAILIWDSVEPIDELSKTPGHTLTDPVSSRVERMLADEYGQFDLPEDSNFSKITMYIRDTSG